MILATSQALIPHYPCLYQHINIDRVVILAWDVVIRIVNTNIELTPLQVVTYMVYFPSMCIINGLLNKSYQLSKLTYIQSTRDLKRLSNVISDPRTLLHDFKVNSLFLSMQDTFFSQPHFQCYILTHLFYKLSGWLSTTAIWPRIWAEQCLVCSTQPSLISIRMNA